MISEQQMERALQEFSTLAAEAFQRARTAERDLESFDYRRSTTYVPHERNRLLEAYNEADYVAESRAWIKHLIQNALAQFTESNQ